MSQQSHKIVNPVPLWVMNLAAFCMVVTVSMWLVVSYANQYVGARKAEIETAARALVPPDELAVNPFGKLQLSARAAIVYDVARKTVIYGHNDEMQFPLASLTKLMTALVALNTLPSYTSVPIVPLRQYGDTNLHPGDRWRFSNLLSYTLMVSSNTGADSIAAAAGAVMTGKGTADTASSSPAAFIDAMNQKAHELGLSQTYFINDSGLDTSTTVSGAYGSARDVALLLSYLLSHHPDVIQSTTRAQEDFTTPDGRTIVAHNTDTVVSKIPGLIGSKTGLTDLAGGNLAVAFDASFGEPMIVVVLGSTEEGRFTDTQALVQATITYLGDSIRRAGISVSSPSTL